MHPPTSKAQQSFLTHFHCCAFENDAHRHHIRWPQLKEILGGAKLLRRSLTWLHGESVLPASQPADRPPLITPVYLHRSLNHLLKITYPAHKHKQKIISTQCSDTDNIYTKEKDMNCAAITNTFYLSSQIPCEHMDAMQIKCSPSQCGVLECWGWWEHQQLSNLVLKSQDISRVITIHPEADMQVWTTFYSSVFRHLTKNHNRQQD